MKEKDKYDLQIEELTEHPERIEDQWDKGIGIFQYVSFNGEFPILFPSCGCLVMIRQLEDRRAIFWDKKLNKELTSEIKSDERIPNRPQDITVESLPVFAEWQRKLDKYRTTK